LKILITGGEGFIARNLREFLAADHEVIGLGHQEFDLLDTRCVADRLTAGRFDAVIHAATYDAAPKHSSKDPGKVLENNLRMFFNIARCKGQFGKMIYFGSGAEFSRPYWKPRMSEDYFDQHVPEDQYGLSKYVMTKYVLRAPCNIYNLRLFGVFGKYDDWRTRFVPNACCRVAMEIPVVMNQNRVFDHLYVNDLARIVNWCLKGQPRHNVYNVCSGRTYDFKTLADIIMKVAGKNLDVMAKIEGLGPEYSGDNSLLLGEFLDSSLSPIADALKELYYWYVGHSEIVRRDLL
jgi:UDP-glucose 4-epimerase